MELLDKLAILLVLFLVARIIRLILEKRNGKPEETKDPGDASAAAKALALLLAAGLCLPAAGGFVAEARAEDTSIRTEINYNDYVQTIYSSTNGLPCGEANDIAMTGDGIMWVGTYAGLYRYNGR